MRVRGLKQVGNVLLSLHKVSHPVRVRGLKLSNNPDQNGVVESHPVRVRGLKQTMAERLTTQSMVAPRAGAWIETLLIGA